MNRVVYRKRCILQVCVASAAIFFMSSPCITRSFLVLVNFPSRWSLVLPSPLSHIYQADISTTLSYADFRTVPSEDRKSQSTLASCAYKWCRYGPFSHTADLSAPLWLTYSPPQCTVASCHFFVLHNLLHSQASHQTDQCRVWIIGWTQDFSQCRIYISAAACNVMVPGSKKLSTWHNEPCLFAQMGDMMCLTPVSQCCWPGRVAGQVVEQQWLVSPAHASAAAAD